MNILFIIPYPLHEAPSQRFRFEQYLKILVSRGYVYDIQSFYDSHSWQLFFRSGNIIYKAFALVKGYCRRFILILNIKKYDYVFIHREAAPLGPPVFEWLITRVFKKKVIYDFDDAIWLTDKKNESAVLKFLKCRAKVASICKWSYRISCGNAFLCAYAQKFNPTVFVNPTTIDTETLHNPQLYSKEPHAKITIGWTGTHSTLKHLKEIEHVLRELTSQIPSIQIVVIADQQPSFSIRPMVFKQWNIATEIEDLLQFDIGIMPLPDDEWALGKCGFKALQYMSLEIPTVASPVGVNRSIIRHGEDGLLASDAREWITGLTTLINDKEKRKKMGSSARKKVIAHYSVASNSGLFLSLFE
jgi:glycosyltransferase involved in cell wall biosynthesis